MRHGAGDAGRPQRDVAARALDQLALGDDVGDREPAAGAQRARRGAEHARLVGREVDDAVGDHDVDAAGLDRRLLDQPVEEREVAEPGAVAQRGAP